MTRFRYVSGEYGHPDTFDQLKTVLDEADTTLGTSGNRLFYLATIPALFGVVATALGKHGLCHARAPTARFARLVVEKPFGRDLASALALNAALHATFDEDQIFRIDHYMGKETVQNVLALRFANAIFEADLEPPLHRQRPDHRGRAARRRAPGRLLRDGRGAARHRPEPRHAGAGPHPDGAARHHRGPGHPRREGEAAPGRRHPQRRRGRGRGGAGPVRGGDAIDGEAVAGLPRRSTASTPTAAPRPTWP